MENIFNQFCSKIDYNTYQKIQNSAIAVGAGSAIAKPFFEQYPIAYNSVEVVYISALIGAWSLFISNGKIHTKDINEIRTLYQQFIKNYNQLNKMFEFSNPIEIYAMFNDLLRNGYLSKDKKFQISKKEARDIKTMYGANIILGSGVCRHISHLLKDILDDYGIEAFTLGCLYNEYILHIKLMEQKDFSYDELKDWVLENALDEDKERLNKVIKFLEEKKQYAEFSYKLKQQKLRNKVLGDHVICFSRYEGNDYYLDSTNEKIFRLDANSKMLYDTTSADYLNVKASYNIGSSVSDSFIKKNMMLSNPCSSISIEEEQELISKTQKICEQNRDIFEQFYNENKEIYDEISNRLIRIPKNWVAKFSKE